MQPNETPEMDDGEAISVAKEIKLQLPLRAHVHLHRLKLLKNQSIRDSVVRALDSYFHAHPLEPIGAPGPAAMPIAASA